MKKEIRRIVTMCMIAAMISITLRMYRQAIITFIINRMKDCYEKRKSSYDCI